METLVTQGSENSETGSICKDCRFLEIRYSDIIDDSMLSALCVMPTKQYFCWFYPCDNNEHYKNKTHCVNYIKKKKYGESYFPDNDPEITGDPKIFPVSQAQETTEQNFKVRDVDPKTLSYIYMLTNNMIMKMKL